MLYALSKTLECVSHHLLLHMLNAYGVALSLLRSYQHNHKQNDDLGDSNASNLEPIETGIPQGSFLGSLIFMIFINDLFINLYIL